MLLSTSILSVEDKKKAIIDLNETTTDYLHFDVMDGKFVPNKAYSIKELQQLITISNKKVDIHLMVENPLIYIKKISILNIDYITFHIEITKDIKSLINEVKSYGIKCGIAINPDTDISIIYPYLLDIDLVLIMSVNPGYGNQEFNYSVLDKIKRLNEELEQYDRLPMISIDGGINDETINQIQELNIDMIVVGSFITNEGSYQTQINKLK